MSRNRLFTGSRLLVYTTALLGLVRTGRDAMAEAGAPSEQIDPTTHSEPDDLNATAVLLVGIGILFVIWAIVVVIYPLFRYYSYQRIGGKDPSKVLVYLPPLPPRPRNQHAPKVDLQNFRAREEGKLHSYFWVDRNKGIISIPIERAIKLLAQRGIPATQPGQNYYPPHEGSMRTGLEGKVEVPPQ